MTIRFLVADALSPEGVAMLKAQPGFQVDVKTGLAKTELLDIIGNYDALLVRSQTKVTAEVIAAAKSLKLIGRAGIGVDNIDVKAATAAGVLVMNAPDGNAITTAEHAIALLFSLARQIPDACASLRSGKWEKSKFNGTEIHGKTLGIIGLGKIGRIVAALARGIRMQIVAYDPFLTQDVADEVGAKLLPFHEVLAQSDFLTIHTTLSDATRHLLNAEAFAKLKKGSFVIHAARGGIIDEVALLEALENGTVRGAALDVFEEEPPAPDHALLKHPRVICTPHLGASTEEAQNRVAFEIAEQARDYFLHGEKRNVINLKHLVHQH
jgi:D-3-phosphoglycerate dehydrogenase